jgi:hypothetical protein
MTLERMAKRSSHGLLAGYVAQHTAGGIVSLGLKSGNEIEVLFLEQAAVSLFVPVLLAEVLVVIALSVGLSLCAIVAPVGSKLGLNKSFLDFPFESEYRAFALTTLGAVFEVS